MKEKLLLVSILVLFGIAGEMDYQDQVAQEQAYIKDVCAGYVPDYENLKPKCKENYYGNGSTN